MDHKIEDIFLVDSVLIVISKTKIFQVQLGNCPKTISVKEIFENRKEAATDMQIKDAKFSKQHQCFYLLLQNKNDEKSIIFKFTTINGKAENFLKSEISKKVDSFEINRKDKYGLFLICQKEVFNFNMKRNLDKSQNNTIRKSSIGGNLLKRRKKRKKYRSKSKLQDDEDELYDRIYSNPKHEIQFFKFDHEMKYFYTHDDKIIKKYLFETSAFIRSFEGHNETLKSLMFTDDFSFMIRYYYI